MRCLSLSVVFVGNFAVRIAVADAGVEIDAFREGRAERLRDVLRNSRVDVAAPGGELDPQLAFGLVIDETADDGRRHRGPSTHQAASGAASERPAIALASRPTA